MVLSPALGEQGGPGGSARRAGPQLASCHLGASLCPRGFGILLGLVGIVIMLEVITWLGEDASGKGLRSLERVARSRGYPRAACPGCVGRASGACGRGEGRVFFLRLVCQLSRSSHVMSRGGRGLWLGSHLLAV